MSTANHREPEASGCCRCLSFYLKFIEILGEGSLKPTSRQRDRRARWSDMCQIRGSGARSGPPKDGQVVLETAELQRRRASFTCGLVLLLLALQ